MNTSADRSARLSLAFSCLGHTYSHLFAPIFYIVALTLERDWAMSHGEVVGLIVTGNVLFGVAAPLSGWLGDRWSATGMVGLFFAGTGAAMILTGTATTPFEIALWLAVTGLFASIYHPVGIAWLVRNATARGRALGINGVFGGIGPAVAALLAGSLTELCGWRAAFIVPGAMIIATGAVYYALIARGVIIESKTDRKPDPPTSRQDTVRAFMVLTVTMVCTGLIYQATQPALPKVFSERLAAFLSDGVLGVSMLVAVVYLVAGGMQVVAGHLADRYPMKVVYVACFALQVPFALLAGMLAGAGLMAVAMLLVTFNVGALPAENGLVARYSPSRWRGLAFGMKFIFAFGVSGLGVQLEGRLYDLTGGFFWLFVVLSAIAMVGVLAAMLLPTERRQPAAVPAQ
jgi:MFS family permease